MATLKENLTSLVFVVAISMLIAAVISGISSLSLSIPPWVWFLVIGIALFAVYAYLSRRA